MGRKQSDKTAYALRYFKAGDSLTVAAAKAGIEQTTLIRALRRALKPGGYK